MSEPTSLHNSSDAKSAPDLLPIVISRGDGGKFHGHRLSDRDQHCGILGVHRTKSFTHCGVWLRDFDDQARHFNCELSAFLWRLSDQRIAWNKLNWIGWCAHFKSLLIRLRFQRRTLRKSSFSMCFSVAGIAIHFTASRVE